MKATNKHRLQFRKGNPYLTAIVLGIKMSLVHMNVLDRRLRVRSGDNVTQSFCMRTLGWVGVVGHTKNDMRVILTCFSFIYLFIYLHSFLLSFDLLLPPFFLSFLYWSSGIAIFKLCVCVCNWIVLVDNNQQNSRTIQPTSRVTDTHSPLPVFYWRPRRLHAPKHFPVRNAANDALSG